jgi:perosamine synthetase
MFEELNLLGREKFISPENRERYRRGLCPAAERIQPKLLQFKTNYWRDGDAERQAEILRRTLKSF